MQKLLANIKQPIEFWLLSAAAFVTRLLWIGWPGAVVFDEVHFGKFLSAYVAHTPFFDIHPPAAKLMYALIAYLGNLQPGFPFTNIGQIYTADVPITALRLLPAILGALLVPLVYLIARRIGTTRAGAALAAGFALFDNALIVQSRFMLLDIPLLFFGFCSIYFFLVASQRVGRYSTSIYFTLSALVLGIALSIKWTALAFYVPLFVLFMILHAKQRTSRFFGSALVALFVFLPAFLYVGFFAIHFLLTEPATLTNFPLQFLTLQAKMYTSNLQVLTHPYQSAWWQWPWLGRSIYYWVLEPGGVPINWIYLLGNPLVWWVSLAGVCASIAMVIKQITRRSAPVFPFPLLLAGFFASLLPFIPIDRALFLYHYFTSLVFSFLLFGGLLDHFIKKSGARRIVVLSLLFCAALVFLYFAPLSYGTRLTEVEFARRMWLPGWR